MVHFNSYNSFDSLDSYPNRWAMEIQNNDNAKVSDSGMCAQVDYARLQRVSPVPWLRMKYLRYLSHSTPYLTRLTSIGIHGELKGSKPAEIAPFE
jgi:hypothetical protein